MDSTIYLSQILHQKINGIIYGCLDQQSLNQAWQTIHNINPLNDHQ